MQQDETPETRAAPAEADKARPAPPPEARTGPLPRPLPEARPEALLPALFARVSLHAALALALLALAFFFGGFLIWAEEEARRDVFSFALLLMLPALALYLGHLGFHLSARRLAEGGPLSGILLFVLSVAFLAIALDRLLQEEVFEDGLLNMAYWLL